MQRKHYVERNKKLFHVTFILRTDFCFLKTKVARYYYEFAYLYTCWLNLRGNIVCEYISKWAIPCPPCFLCTLFNRSPFTWLVWYVNYKSLLFNVFTNALRPFRFCGALEKDLLCIEKYLQHYFACILDIKHLLLFASKWKLP